MKAAESIEKAAKRLEDIKKKKNSEQVSLEDMAFDDLIIESVQSVTKAATSLISAATAAQKVLVAEGKMSGGGKKVKEDSQWSQGLVSAANLVASVIGSLCEAANTVIQVESCIREFQCNYDWCVKVAFKDDWCFKGGDGWECS